MHLFLDICQGLGLATAAGVRPFMPAIVGGLFATANWGVDFDHTDYAFLENPVWLVAIAVLLVLTFFIRRQGEAEFVDSAIGGIGIGVGALLFMGSLADHGRDHGVWLVVGIGGGILAALVGHAAYRSLLARTSARLDAQARNALPLWFDGVGLVLAALSVAIPPVSLVALPALAWLFVGGRRRDGGRYAGLRILR